MECVRQTTKHVLIYFGCFGRPFLDGGALSVEKNVSVTIQILKNLMNNLIISNR